MASSVQLQARCGLGQISGFLLKSYISTQQTTVSVFLQTLTEGLKHTLATPRHDNQNCINTREITDRMADTMALRSAVDTASTIKTNTKFYN